MKRSILIAGALALVATAGLAAFGGLSPIAGRLGWQDKTAATAPVRSKTADATSLTAPAVTVEPATRQELVARTRVTGTLVPRTEILVAPEIEGLRVVELFVEAGDRVTAGQVLARLVQDGLDAQLAQNEAAIARTEAAIAQAKSQITQAEAREAEARANFERAAPLRQSGALSQSVFEQRQAAARAAQAALVAARDALGVTQAERAQVAAQRRELVWRMNNTRVKAPADGLVSRRTARIGALATAVGEPMFRIIANGEIELEADVPETEIAALAVGQSAEIVITGGRAVPGQVRLVSPEIDKATRLGHVRILISASEGLKIGAFARGFVETARRTGLAVPASAVVYGPDGASVQIVRDGTVVTRRVEIGLHGGGLVAVLNGLVDGDLVVTKAGSFLREGDKVRPVVAAPQRITGVN